MQKNSNNLLNSDGWGSSLTKVIDRGVWSAEHKMCGWILLYSLHKKKKKLCLKTAGYWIGKKAFQNFLREREKMLITSIFSFSSNVFKTFVTQVREKNGIL